MRTKKQVDELFKRTFPDWNKTKVNIIPPQGIIVIEKNNFKMRYLGWSLTEAKKRFKEQYKESLSK